MFRSFHKDIYRKKTLDQAISMLKDLAVFGIEGRAKYYMVTLKKLLADVDENLLFKEFSNLAIKLEREL